MQNSLKQNDKARLHSMATIATKTKALRSVLWPL